jgi:5-methyltetrahydrofolate--homocysteine methyltransferase
MNLLDFILHGNEIILLDGALGTQLAEAGLEMGGWTNLSHPDSVQAIHRQYAECGVNLLSTNTFTLNRLSIESHNVKADVREVNVAGIKLARAAAREGQYVVGDMGSTGQMLKPYGKLSEEDALRVFREQAEILDEGGVDGFIIETMIHLKEALVAVKACIESSRLPVIASMAFNTLSNGGRTIMGDSAGDCARALADAGASVVGANCGNLDPFQMAEIVATMRSVTSLPLVVQPNAGKPLFIDNRTVFDMPPSQFAEGVAQCVKAGARLVGGCCGTSPAHIRALADMRTRGF